LQSIANFIGARLARDVVHPAAVYDPMEPDAVAVVADIPRLKLSDPVDHVLIHL
jgi:hypothetical protein